MTDLFTTRPMPPKAPEPLEHYCLICDAPASRGFALRPLPARANGPARPGDHAFGCVWYCAEHAQIGIDLLKRQKGGPCAS